ncbi:hypothetical protein TNCV_4809381 [Trichonephila clavipes]|nr:hypothetical protein TNCV_4809381 [Trichonephila clavipes]
MENTIVWLFTKELTNTPNRKRIHEGKEQSCRKQGYYPLHGMSSFQSFPRQLPPPQRNGCKAVPIFDPKTEKNENSDPNVRVQFDTQAAAVLKEPTSKSVETAIAPDSQTVLYPIVESETVKSQDSNSNVEPSVAFSEDKKNAELIIEDDSSYIGQESIPAKETVIPTSWNETSVKNTSAVSSKIQEKQPKSMTTVTWWKRSSKSQVSLPMVQISVDSEESADCQGHPNTANSIEKDSNFRICNHCWRGEVRKTPNPVKIGNLNFHARFKLQSLPLMTESCKLEKSATCATLQNV